MISPRAHLSPNGSVDENDNKPASETMDITTAKFKVSQVKRQDTQKTAFTRWFNSKLPRDDESPIIKDLFVDLRDGNKLLTLLEILTGRKTNRVHGKLRLHKLNNVNVALELLKEYKVKLVNIGNTDIVDGVPVPTLGLVWSIIYRFQIQGALADILRIEQGPSSPVDEKDAEKAILDWCAEAVEGYEGVNIKNFSTSWRDGLAFNALIHRYKPTLFIYKSLLSNTPEQNLEHAFSLADRDFGVHRLLEPTDFQREMIDSRLVVLYISTLYEKLKDLEPKLDHTVTLEEIEELKSYIIEEMEFLKSCEKFFEEAIDVENMASREEMLDQYQKLLSFIDDLQPNQMKVGELVNQIETLIAKDLVAEEEIEPIQNELHSLKSLWQKIFDETSSRQDKLHEKIVELIDRPIKMVDDELLLCKEKLKDFETDSTELQRALHQYDSFQDYIAQLRLLETKIEAIRTGEEAGDVLEVLSEEDAEIVSTNIQGMIEAFVDLGENVARVKNRLHERILDLIQNPIKIVDDELILCKEKLKGFQNDESELQPALDQYNSFQDYIAQLRQLEEKIEAIRTGEEAGDALEVLSDEDADIVATNIQGTIQAFVDLGENAAATKNRITDNLYHLLSAKVDELENTLSLGKKIMSNDANNNNNNNQMNSGLEEKLAAYEEQIQKVSKMKPDIELVSDLASKIDENFYSELDEADELNQRITDLFESCEDQLEELKRRIQETEGQIVSEGRLGEWKSEFGEVMVWIKEKEHELESMDDLESSLVMLEEAASKMESLYADISNYQEKIDSVVQAGSKIVKEEEVSSESIPSIRSDIRSLESTWELLREKCTAVQLSIREKVLIRQVQEKQFMSEWDETHMKIEFWLSNAEKEAEPFDKAHENIIDVENQVAEHEELVFRMATEEKTINDLLDVGEKLAVEKLRLVDNKAKVKADLKNLKKRKTKLNAKVVGQQQSLTSFLDHLVRIESEVFDAWVKNCKSVENTLLDLGKTENDENIDTVDSAREYLRAEEELLAEIENLKPKVDDVLIEGEDVMASGKLGKLRTQGLKTAMRSVRELYEKKLRNSCERLKEIMEELSNMQQQQMEQITNWITKSETFDRWIDSESNGLEVLLVFPEGEEEPTLDKVLSEEQAVRDIKGNADARTSILEALMKEGSTLKENQNIQSDLPEEYARAIELMVGIQYKWEVLLSNIDEKFKRVMGMVSEMQGQLLSVCVSQIDGIESVINGLGPISDGFDTLAKDAEDLSELFMMIGQTRGNIARFDKYAKELQTSEELQNAAKFEVREANEMLHNRITAVSETSDERKLKLHERIIDVLTESLVALNDTISSLEQKCDDVVIPDNLETVDLVERHATLEDILNRLVACKVSLKDIESLGQAADNYMILETGEPDDVMNEIEVKKEFIDHVQRMAREKKSRIYGLMVYTFKRRIEELDKLLTNIEEGVTDPSSAATVSIQGALECMGDNEASLQELEDIQRNGEEVTMQVNEIIESNAISNQDKEELQEKNSKFVDHLADVLTSLKIENDGLKQSFANAVKEKLLELREWLDLMEKRRESDDQIGPDSMAIKKQITEMNVIESQLKDKTLTPQIHCEDDIALLCLDSETLEELKEVEHDLHHLSGWINHRKKLLVAAQDAWEIFRQVEVDLLDYLRDKERQIKNWEPINLEDENAVAERLAILREMLSVMEERKDDVQNMHKAADDVIDLIGEETAMANNIKSQVADIHDCWNNTVRQVIEAISKLNFAKERLQNLEEGISEVRLWLDDARSILKFYTPDIPEDVMEDLKPRVQEKYTETLTKRSTLNKVNYLSRELLDDIDGPSHDIIHTDLAKLNKDWNEVTNDLERKKDLKKRPCCWWCYRRWFLKYGYYN